MAGIELMVLMIFSSTLEGMEAVPQLRQGLGAYFPFYDDERRHQSLDYRTPAEGYRRGKRAG